LVGGADSCFDDPRASVVYADAIAWFKDNFGGNEPVRDELFDVVIFDAL
jgi:predicted membrane-bound spermidine synthase